MGFLDLFRRAASTARRVAGRIREERERAELYRRAGLDRRSLELAKRHGLISEEEERRLLRRALLKRARASGRKRSSKRRRSRSRGSKSRSRGSKRGSRRRSSRSRGSGLGLWW